MNSFSSYNPNGWLHDILIHPTPIKPPVPNPQLQLVEDREYDAVQNQETVNHPIQQVELYDLDSGIEEDCLRTIYFGNLPPDITISRFLNYVHGGLIDTIKQLSEKNCIFITFIFPENACAIFKEFQTRRLSINGFECKIGWGNPHPINKSVRNQVLKGASRNVYCSNLDHTMTEDWLRSEFSKFGAIESIKILREKRIGFVHMTSIVCAIKAVQTLMSEKKWQHRKIFYGRDRCAEVLSHHQSGSLIQAESIDSLNLVDDCANLTIEGTIQSRNSSDANRTVYIGGIPANILNKDICDAIRGGNLQTLKYFPEKNIAFATFMEPSAASAFYDRHHLDYFIIKSRKMKVGWGKGFSPLQPSLNQIYKSGGTRNIYLGQLDQTHTPHKLETDFSMFGEIEHINHLIDKRYAFISFTDISCAIRALSAIKEYPEYRRVKVGYGKDRCGFPVRERILTPPATPEPL